jgi:hypothetical protein
MMANICRDLIIFRESRPARKKIETSLICCRRQELCWVVSSGFGGNPMDPGLNKAALMHSKTCKDESEYPEANGVMAHSRKW